ncbi:MAG: DUF420 domain-containing protein [Planctomycetota bacterium]|jgi:uncharacterized membrane protein YozB (DUF420 family)
MFDTGAGLFVDLFLVLLVAILIAMLVAVALVRRGRVRAHAVVMATCFGVFVVALVTFELEVRFGPVEPLALTPLVIHLCFALPALVLWTRQIWTARRARSQPARHRRRGWLLLVLLSLTVATGFWLYWATFL